MKTDYSVLRAMEFGFLLSYGDVAKLILVGRGAETSSVRSSRQSIFKKALNLPARNDPHRAPERWPLRFNSLRYYMSGGGSGFALPSYM
jgi:hypothetical protein